MWRVPDNRLEELAGALHRTRTEDDRATVGGGCADEGDRHNRVWIVGLDLHDIAPFDLIRGAGAPEERLVPKTVVLDTYPVCKREPAVHDETESPGHQCGEDERQPMGPCDGKPGAHERADCHEQQEPQASPSARLNGRDSRSARNRGLLASIAGSRSGSSSLAGCAGYGS